MLKGAKQLNGCECTDGCTVVDRTSLSRKEHAAFATDVSTLTFWLQYLEQWRLPLQNRWALRRRQLHKDTVLFTCHKSLYRFWQKTLYCRAYTISFYNHQRQQKTLQKEIWCAVSSRHTEDLLWVWRLPLLFPPHYCMWLLLCCFFSIWVRKLINKTAGWILVVHLIFKIALKVFF